MTAMARRTDPCSSHKAAAAVEQFAPSHRGVLRELLRKAPGSTYRELFAKHVSECAKKRQALVIQDAPSLMRRLRDVANVVGSRECRVTRRECSIWELREGQ